MTNPFRMEADDALRIAAGYRSSLQRGDYRSTIMGASKAQQLASDLEYRRLYLEAARDWLARARKYRLLDCVS